jgi:hypothetical protein
MMKKKMILGVAAPLLAATGACWFASGAQADDSPQDFVLVSNRTGIMQDWYGFGHSHTVCVREILKAGRQSQPATCETIPAHTTHLWYYNPADVAQVVVTGLGRTFPENGPGNYCFRISRDHKLHPVTDSCTPN